MQADLNENNDGGQLLLLFLVIKIFELSILMNLHSFCALMVVIEPDDDHASIISRSMTYVWQLSYQWSFFSGS
jgi:hypothetical protein